MRLSFDYHTRQVYRGIRKPYLHLMHDVMSLEGEEEEGNGDDAGDAATATASKADASVAPPTPHQRQQRTSLLRAWHQRGNPFRMPDDNYQSSESPATAAAEDSGGVTGTGDGGGGGVGLGKLPGGTDVDDEPDTVAVSLRGPGGEAGGARRQDFGGGGDGAVDELEAEDER